MAFERQALGDGPLAVLTEGNRDRIRVFLNGEEIYRNFARTDDPVAAWYAPVLIPIPPDRLDPGLNELSVVILNRWDIGAGHYEIGPQAVLAGQYDWLYLWRIDVPRKVNFAMVMLAYGALLYWAFTRREIPFAIVGVTSFLWFVSNYVYLFDTQPGGQLAYALGPDIFLVLAACGTLSFSAVFGNLRPRAVVWTATGGALAGLVTLVAIWRGARVEDAGAHLIAILLFALGAGLAWRAWRRRGDAEVLALAGFLAVFAAAGVHDFGRLWYVHAWNGLGIYLQPYLGFAIDAGFLFSFGRRSVAAFASLQRVNTELEARIVEVRRELAASEAARRELEVAQAVEVERERLLREIHDGIGSNLVTALRIAEQQNQPPANLRTLRRALSDLKVTIDSLEPVEGDIVALLANLRHRMERDLKDAGVACRWRAEACPPLPWLDAPNALHLLRIFQEAIGNSLAHAAARELEIGCHAAAMDGQQGLTAYVRDDGRGFDPAAGGAGRGVANMRARARALRGRFECESRPGAGTRVAIWLPYAR
jgi:signal transduction histidine kinase